MLPAARALQDSSTASGRAEASAGLEVLRGRANPMTRSLLASTTTPCVPWPSPMRWPAARPLAQLVLSDHTPGMKPGKRWLKAIAPSDDPDSWVPVVVEIASGSKMKYALDKASGQLELHRALAAGLAYPTNYGFVPRTLGSDGAELDMMILAAEPLLPLTIVRVRPIGGCTIHERGAASEDKLIGVAVGDPSVEHLADIAEVPAELRAQIEQFYRTFKRDQGVEVEFQGWFGRIAAGARLKAGLGATRSRWRPRLLDVAAR